MKSILILALSILFFCGSCTKEEPEKLELPPYTQDGRNIFACKINGNIFIVEGKEDEFQTMPGVSYINVRDSLTTISGESENPFDADVTLNFIHSKDKTSFKLTYKEDNSAYVRINDAKHSIPQAKYTTTQGNTGSVNVTYYQNNIIAGTFEFDAVSDYGDTVHVTEGRFDLSTQ